MIQDPILSIHMINKIKIDIGNQPYLKIPLIVETIIFEFFFLHAYKEYVRNTHTHTHWATSGVATVKGCKKVEGVDFSDTFSSRQYLIPPFRGWDKRKLDVKNVFLH